VTAAMMTRKFFVASICMWAVPFAILYGFQHGWYPGFSNISPSSQTLLSGFLAVVSVNIMLAFYICMAMKEPIGKHKPDPAFVAKATVTNNQRKPSGGAKVD
uniref:Vacuolar ATPase assembly integral membrane protein VMA21 homolog n=2 Tax=Chenopodium quinoa TaxID=63459 RepID=A0A803N049_CHEQI